MSDALKLYRIEQNANNDYDTYDSAVVAAETKNDAQCMHPAGDLEWDPGKEEFFKLRKDGSIYVPYGQGFRDWAHPKNVAVDLIGVATNATFPHVICASYNAG